MPHFHLSLWEKAGVRMPSIDYIAATAQSRSDVCLPFSHSPPLLMSTEAASTAAHTSPKWRPLEAIERRVLGVLIEKAKTTPENYPLSANSLRSGCNQKNNRSPLMQLEEPPIEEALDKLRQLGAVAVVQGSGRVDRHSPSRVRVARRRKGRAGGDGRAALRGAQTVGELRGRAARMEPIKDLGDLRPTLDSLEKKGLILYLTPPGRGCVVTHALLSRA